MASSSASPSPSLQPAAAPPPEDPVSSASPPAPFPVSTLPPTVSPPLPPPVLPVVTPVASPPSYFPSPPPPSILVSSPLPLPIPAVSSPQLPPPSDVSPPHFPSPAPSLPAPSPPSPVTAALPPAVEPIQVPPVFAPQPTPVRVPQRTTLRPSQPSHGKRVWKPSPVLNPPSVESPPGSAPAISPPAQREPSPVGRSESPPPLANATAALRTPPVATATYSHPNTTVAPFTGNPVPSQHQMGIGVVNRTLPVATGAQSHDHSMPVAAPKSNVPAWIAGGATITGVLFVVLLVWRLSRSVLRRKRARSATDTLNHNKVQNHVGSLPQEAFLLQYDRSSRRVNSDRSLLGSDETRVPAISSSFTRGLFTYDELAEATNGFSDTNLLGEGGFGYVHMGVLPNRREIAVKQLKIGSQQGEREFRAELNMITRVHHKHLVALMGYCVTEMGRYLVYEFVPNKTLEFHLHGAGSGQRLLDWGTRMKIAIGSAKGIMYLHEDCCPKIIHRDIKAANILLDFYFDAKVSDFGLSKLFGDTNAQVTHVITRVVGTFGYLAPEYAATGKLTEKSDVYSYGVVLLELITGRPPVKRLDVDTNEGLVDSVRPLINQAVETGNYKTIVDERLGNDYEHGQMARMIRCAAACIRHSAWLRPRMSQIIRTLEGGEPLTELDDGGTSPGDSRLHGSAEMSKFFRVLAVQEYSDATSEHGLHPCSSSSEFQQMR